MLLVQSTTFIIGPIARLLGYIMNVIYNGLSSIGIENVAICIILFTIIIQIFMIPLKYKSQKFTRLTSIIQPEINKIRNKYKGKKDNQSMALMQQETQEVYRKYGSSPTGGCLPMLVQMPILFALYAVIQYIPSYIQSINNLYLKVATVVDTNQKIEIIKKIKDLPRIKLDLKNKETIIDYLYNFNIGDWDKLTKSITDVTGEAVDKIIHISRVIGDVLVSDTPWSLIKENGYIHWIWILPILVYVTSYLSMKTAQSKNQPQTEGAIGANQMKTMSTIMPIISVVFSIALPVGLGIYWITNSLLMSIQQIAINRYIDKIGIENIIKESIEKNKEKNQKSKVKDGINPGIVTKAASINTKNMDKVEETLEEDNIKPGTSSMSSIAKLAEKYKND